MKASGPPFSVALIYRTWLADWAFKGWIPPDTKKTWSNCRPLGVATTPIVRCLVSNAAIHKELVSASRVSLQFPCMKTTKGKSTGYIATFSHVHVYIYIYLIIYQQRRNLSQATRWSKLCQWISLSNNLYWLVVSTPLKKIYIYKSVGIIIPNSQHMETYKTCSKPPNSTIN